ncbi:hypothetical protein OPV22_017811 [Ensete ventricosum]|uniref:Uncharacterized protein n=1 Tax=Ensete ventricosum TaxID=4639 RepID=A0AAV8PFB3_ENSVE|nr:hypothetical protein OPV22_017806 [Ensete ventricosum]KAJ8485326.1 hypothetical protein OPV22_017811 [Ensete ventricosum]
MVGDAQSHPSSFRGLPCTHRRMVLPPFSAVLFDMAIAIRRCCKIYKDVAGKGSDLKAGDLHARGAVVGW